MSLSGGECEVSALVSWEWAIFPLRIALATSIMQRQGVGAVSQLPAKEGRVQRKKEPLARNCGSGVESTSVVESLSNCGWTNEVSWLRGLIESSELDESERVCFVLTVRTRRKLSPPTTLDAPRFTRSKSSKPESHHGQKADGEQTSTIRSMLGGRLLCMCSQQLRH